MLSVKAREAADTNF